MGPVAADLEPIETVLFHQITLAFAKCQTVLKTFDPQRIARLLRANAAPAGLLAAFTTSHRSSKECERLRYRMVGKYFWVSSGTNIAHRRRARYGSVGVNMGRYAAGAIST